MHYMYECLEKVLIGKTFHRMGDLDFYVPQRLFDSSKGVMVETCDEFGRKMNYPLVDFITGKLSAWPPKIEDLSPTELDFVGDFLRLGFELVDLNDLSVDITRQF